MVKRIGTWALYLWPLAVIGGILGYGVVAAQTIDDLANTLPVCATNNGATPLSHAPVPFTVNPSDLSGGGFVLNNFEDMIAVNANGVLVSHMAQDTTDSVATWWVEMDALSAGQTRCWELHMGSATVSTDQGVFLGMASTTPDTITIPHSASLSIDGPFVLETTATVWATATMGADGCLLCKAQAYELGVRAGPEVYGRVWGAIEEVQRGSNTGSSVTLGATPTPGNTVIVAIRRTDTVPALPSGFTSILTESGSGVFLRVAYRVVESGDSATISSGSSAGIQAWEYSNLGALDVSASNTGTSTTSLATGTTATPAIDTSLAIAVLGTNDIIAAPGWSNSFALSQNTGSFLVTGTRLYDAAAPVTSTASWSTIRNAAAAVVVFSALPREVSAPITLGTQYDITLTYDGSALTLDVDGITVDTAAYSGAIATNSASLTIDGLTAEIASTTLTAYIGGGGGSGSITYVTQTSSTDTGPTVTFSGVSFGAADTDRWILVAGETRDNDRRDLQSVTIGGVTADIAFVYAPDDGVSARTHGFFALAAVPTGTTGDVVVTYSGTIARSGVAIYRIIGQPVTLPTDTDGVATNGGAMSLDVLAGGFAVGVSLNLSGGGNPSVTWSGLNEDFEARLPDVQKWSSAHAEFPSGATGQAVTVTYASGEGSVFNSAVASFTFGSATPTTVLDLIYSPATVSQTQEGDANNGWEWRGTVADQSGAGNDGQYAFYRPYVADLDITVEPLTTKPPLPTVLVVNDLADVIGLIPALTGSSESRFFPGLNELGVAIDFAGLLDDAFWFSLVALLGIVLGGGVAKLTQFPPIGFILAGSVIGIGSWWGVYDHWLIVVSAIGLWAVGGLMALVGRR